MQGKKKLNVLFQDGKTAYTTIIFFLLFTDVREKTAVIILPILMKEQAVSTELLKVCQVSFFKKIISSSDL